MLQFLALLGLSLSKTCSMPNFVVTTMPQAPASQHMPSHQPAAAAKARGPLLVSSREEAALGGQHDGRAFFLLPLCWLWALLWGRDGGAATSSPLSSLLRCG